MSTHPCAFVDCVAVALVGRRSRSRAPAPASAVVARRGSTARARRTSRSPMQQWVADAQSRGLAGQLPADQLTRRSHVVRRRPHRLRRAPRPSTPRSVGGGARSTGARLPVRARRRRRDGGHVQRPGPRRPQGRLPAPVAAHDRPDLHGRHHELERPRDHRRQQGSRAARPADHRRVPQRAVGHDRHVLRLRRARRARPLRPVGGAVPAARPTCASSSSTARRPSRRRRSRSAAPTRSRSTSPATPGMWSIGYDEFGYAKIYGAAAAWVQNASGQWVLPYAENISAALESAHAAPRPQPGAVGRVREHEPAGVSDLGVQLPRHAVRAGGRPADVQGHVPEPGRHRDAGAVDAVHRVRRPGEHGADRLLAAAAEPVAGDGELDRPHAGRHARAADRGATARTRASTASLGDGATSPPTRSRTCRRSAADVGGRRRAATGTPTRDAADGTTSATGPAARRDRGEGQRRPQRRQRATRRPAAGAGGYPRAAPVAYDRPGSPPTRRRCLRRSRGRSSVAHSAGRRVGCAHRRRTRRLNRAIFIEFY